MRRAYGAALAAVLLSAGPAVAAPRPYTPVIVSHDEAGTDDPGLQALAKQLTDAANAGEIAKIRELTAPKLDLYAPIVGFPDERPAEALANPDDRPGAERLGQAAMMTTTGEVNYEPDEIDGLVVDLFAQALAGGSLGRATGAGGAICAPAEPVFDRDAALAIADAADISEDNLWILPAATGFRAKPDPAAPVTVTLPAGSIAPYLRGSVEGSDGSDWYEVALPEGGSGFARDDRSTAFIEPRVCFGQVDGRWLVTAIVVPQL